MENQLKMRFTKLFRSCKSKKSNTDVFQQQQPAAAGYHHDHHLVDMFSPKPESPESFLTHQSSSTATFRTKLCVASRSQRDQLPHELIDVEKQMRQNFRGNEKVKTSSKRRNKIRSRSSRNYEFPLCNYNGLFSEDEFDEDDATTVFFSSRSFSSDSTKDRCSMHRNRRSKRTANQKNKLDTKCTCKLLPEGIPVVKHSKDPYTDFMNSMIEMITEKHIFAADELEKLLFCFLSLNSDHHHRIIIHVFKDIWGALFTDYSRSF